MKKTLALLLALSLSSFAFAQEEAPQVDKQIFNHLAAGNSFSFGVLGFEVATTLTPHVQLHGGYSIDLLSGLKVSTNDIRKMGVSIPESIDINNDKRPLDLTAALGLNFGGLKLLADIFPSAHHGFHFTVGFYVPNFSSNLISLDLDASKLLKPNEYASYGFQLDPNDIKTNITSDKAGHLHVDIKSWAVRPYVGLGFGRIIDPAKRVKVTFDMGAMFWGSLSAQSYDYSIKEEGTVVQINSTTLANNKDLNSVGKVLDIMGKVPVLPVLKLNVFVRIF